MHYGVIIVVGCFDLEIRREWYAADNHDHKYSYYSNYDSWEWLVVLVPYLL